MEVIKYLDGLIAYGEQKGLTEPCDRIYLRNRLLELLRLQAYAPSGETLPEKLPEILEGLCRYGVETGLCGEDITSRDLFDTSLMGVLTPFPHEVRKRFWELYHHSPQEATDWFYRFCGDVNYIRRDRIQKDLRWKYSCEYGVLDITVNLSKPEKDPRAIAAARESAAVGYPACQLCPENEGYGGRYDHPARQNHRLIPLRLGGEEWFFQYSPYVYYNEHCILLSGEHRPMKISREAFDRMLTFVDRFPHYFIGSNADLPIVGGSILSHDHFQGGNYTFAMERAQVETEVFFPKFPDVNAGILHWPMSVLRLEGEDPSQLAALGEKLLLCWRGYTDEAALIYAETDGQPHNTITPVARKRGALYQLDLVLRNNLTTKEHPLGLYHPHEELHHIKKENIGLIEVMGLAVLPARLERELAAVKEVLLFGGDLSASEDTGKHAEWAKKIAADHSLNEENIIEVFHKEIGKVFLTVLEQYSVYRRDRQGKTAFLRFLQSAGGKC